MFGTNEIVGKKFFKDASARSIFVTSMFFTLQGEGPYAGMPALFVRFTKCNLACSFCDTFFDDGDWMTFEEIEAKAAKTIEDYFNGNVPDWVKTTFSSIDSNGIETIHRTLYNVVLVVTGGEPLLQTNIVEFLSRQLLNYSAVQIESNGTIDQDIPRGVTLVCSPKCSEKNNIAIKYLSPTKLILERADCLKFVMNADAGSPYYAVPDWAHKWRELTNKDIYVSPMNIYNEVPQQIKLLRAGKTEITIEERSTIDEVISFWSPGLLDMPANQTNHEYVARYCMQHGFKLNLQMHLYASLA